MDDNQLYWLEFRFASSMIPRMAELPSCTTLARLILLFDECTYCLLVDVHQMVSDHQKR